MVGEELPVEVDGVPGLPEVGQTDGQAGDGGPLQQGGVVGLAVISFV